MAGFRRRAIVLLFWLIVGEGQAQGVADDPDPPDPASAYFTAGNEAFAREDYRSALNAFQAAIDAGSEGPAAPYNAAVSLYRLGEYAAAEESFRALAAAYPDMQSLADYNLGLALVRQNETDAARAAFARAAAADDTEVAALATAMIERLPVPPRAMSMRAPLRLLDIGLGYDDNVALIDPLALPAGQSADSPFAEFLFYADGTLANRWRVAGTAFLLEYPDTDEFDQGVYEVSLQYVERRARWALAAGPRLGRSYIGGSGFEQSVGVGLEWERTLAAIASVLAVELAYDEAEELEPQFAYIDGNRARIGLRLSRAFDRARMSFEIRHENHDRAGAGVSAERLHYRWRLRSPIGAAWSGELDVELRDTDYDRLMPGREEQRAQLSLGAGTEISADWWLALRYTYADNDSTDPLYGYRRHRLSAGVSRRFGGG
jgi:tetratricopeptide (TPR) repeat protein